MANAVKLIVQPDAGIAPVVQAIRQAKTRVDIAIFRLDRSEVEKALAAAVTRGVKVRALIAHTNRGGEGRLRKLEQRLLGQGVLVARSADVLDKYHGKFMLVDHTLHVFGFNFTRLDVDKSRSFGIQTRDRRAVNEAAKLFEADTTRQPYQPGVSPLVVSPESARPMLHAFIAGARRELAIYDTRLQDRAFVKLLQGLASRGVRIRIIGASKEAGEGIEVRALKGLRQHVRAIVRDGTRAFVGSQSLRKSELSTRREVGLIITNPQVARAILKVFEVDWEAAVHVKGSLPDEPPSEPTADPAEALALA